MTPGDRYRVPLICYEVERLFPLASTHRTSSELLSTLSPPVFLPYVLFAPARWYSLSRYGNGDDLPTDTRRIIRTASSLTWRFAESLLLLVASSPFLPPLSLFRFLRRLLLSISGNSGELLCSGKGRWKTGRWKHAKGETERYKMKGWEWKRRKRRSYRVSDKIQRARSDSCSYLSLSLSVFYIFLSYSRTVTSLSSHFSRGVRTRSFTSPGARFFPTRSSGIPPLLTARLPLSPADRRGSDPRRRVLLRSSLDSTINLSKEGISSIRVLLELLLKLRVFRMRLYSNAILVISSEYRLFCFWEI